MKILINALVIASAPFEPHVSIHVHNPDNASVTALVNCCVSPEEIAFVSPRPMLPNPLVMLSIPAFIDGHADCTTLTKELKSDTKAETKRPALVSCPMVLILSNTSTRLPPCAAVVIPEAN